MRMICSSILAATLVLSGCHSPAPRMREHSGSGIKYVVLDHPAAKSSFRVVINARAVYVHYHAYMTKTTDFVDQVAPQTWATVEEAIASHDYESGMGDSYSDIHVAIYYVNKDFQSGHVEWKDGVTKGRALRRVYKAYLEKARAY